jgi:hypothetical protein
MTTLSFVLTCLALLAAIVLVMFSKPIGWLIAEWWTGTPSDQWGAAPQAWQQQEVGVASPLAQGKEKPQSCRREQVAERRLADVVAEGLGFAILAPLMLGMAVPLLAMAWLCALIGAGTDAVTAVMAPFARRRAAARAKREEQLLAAKRAEPSAALRRLLGACTDLYDDLGWSGDFATVWAADEQSLGRVAARVQQDLLAVTAGDAATRAAAMALIEACQQFRNELECYKPYKARVPRGAELRWYRACEAAARHLPPGSWQQPWP